ncbi:hypothetical protein QFC22_006582 [Naganishia vaughanmartiniae]|uniref:Uncharacterized protein n=1 Tax=Naganishia vaughanmartiniae TaxID=1424756 RepID=A0ACC2WJF2_9TREE|nr:hypothetical protein QFC22_006582 [Naganishia vaughanmartiniae]
MDAMQGLGLTAEEAELWELLSHDLLPETVNINPQDNVNTLDWDLSQFALDTFPSTSVIAKFEPQLSLDTLPQDASLQPGTMTPNSSHHQQQRPSNLQNSSTQSQETTVVEQAVSAANDLMHSLLTSPTLLINMMVLGTLSMNQSEARHHGDAMWRLVHKGVIGTWDRLIEIRGPYDDCQGVPLILTALLGQMYGLNSNNPEMIRNSLVANYLNFRWAKVSGIYDHASVPNKVDVRNLEGKALDQAWKLWSAKETQRRGILGCYVLDATSSVTFKTTPAVRHTYNPFPALADEDTFVAVTAEDWKRAYLLSCCPQQADLTFSQMYRLLFNPDSSREQLQIFSRLSSLSREVILEGVGSLITEWYESDFGTAFGGPDLRDVAIALARIHDHLLSSPDHVRVPNLCIRWHSMCMRLAKCSQPRDFATSQQSQRDWFATPIGRRAVLHAIAIRLEVDALTISYVRYPHFTLAECLYQAALLLIAYIKTQDSPAAEGVTDEAVPCNVDTPVNWTELGTCSLVSNSTDELWSVTPTQAAYYLQWGGQPTFHAVPINLHDLLSLVNALTSAGQTWRRSALLAREIEMHMM